MVDIQFKQKFKKFISLDEIKSQKSLKEMMVVQRGARLSVQPVNENHFRILKEMGE